MCVKFFLSKASPPCIRRTHVPNLGRLIDTESTKNSYRILKNFSYKGYKLRTTQVFIPDKAHKQNLPPYQHTVCAPI
jgi:hypothetical protein